MSILMAHMPLSGKTLMRSGKSTAHDISNIVNWSNDHANHSGIAKKICLCMKWEASFNIRKTHLKGLHWYKAITECEMLSMRGLGKGLGEQAKPVKEMVSIFLIPIPPTLLCLPFCIGIKFSCVCFCLMIKEKYKKIEGSKQFMSNFINLSKSAFSCILENKLIFKRSVLSKLFSEQVCRWGVILWSRGWHFGVCRRRNLHSWLVVSLKLQLWLGTYGSVNLGWHTTGA